MNKTVYQVAKLTGISVRTLHYYDEIGLLHPSEVTEAGYRLYDDASLERLQQILYFRELDFALKDIGRILDAPSFDKNRALANHKELLVLKRNRLSSLIALVDDTLKGEKTMSFKEFDKSEIEAAQEKYAKEAEARWGDTDAFAESKQKTAGYGKKEWAAITEEANNIYAAFAANMDNDPSEPKVQQLVADWHSHITQYYYNCTKEILAGLGEMYVADERFTQNIDRHAIGLAKFMRDAIRIYCEK
ncbi:MerR family transcriptional regulator [Hydrogenoanaerobacterium sp.]|uniref:MerR family transcriptional regulator n=1 Tax=Hydrogenoanaerobacterium sp. TaxID=2953763 RepID=UPI002899A284|nr:MerR family transcriptional regulator [Hydrogenoanaerobacterium sp.]